MPLYLTAPHTHTHKFFLEWHWRLSHGRCGCGCCCRSLRRWTWLQETLPDDFQRVQRAYLRLDGDDAPGSEVRLLVGGSAAARPLSINPPFGVALARLPALSPLQELASVVSLAASCSRAVRVCGVMSKNETADDINTEDLQYILVDFYHGMLVQQLSGVRRRSHELAAQYARVSMCDRECACECLSAWVCVGACVRECVYS